MTNEAGKDALATFLSDIFQVMSPTSVVYRPYMGEWASKLVTNQPKPTNKPRIHRLP